MFEFSAQAFLEATMDFGTTMAWLKVKQDDENSPFYKDKRLEDKDREFIFLHLKRLTDHLKILGARITEMAVADLQNHIIDPDCDWEDVWHDLSDISRTFMRECSLVTLLSLEPKELGYYNPTRPLFGPNVATKFQTTAAFEIDEAAKCLALGRPTAAVFHLMRLMEIGIRAVSRCLGIPDPTRPAERNWGYILREIKNDLAARGGNAPTKTWTTAGDGEFFEGAYASLDAVRVAWRNTTMHVERKYTDDEAEHIFVAVRGFMSQLASRCDENGDPKA